MVKYKNKESGVDTYEIGDDYMLIGFKQGGVYRYTTDNNSPSTIEAMKGLAVKNTGLNTYINRIKPNGDKLS